MLARTISFRLVKAAHPLLLLLPLSSAAACAARHDPPAARAPVVSPLTASKAAGDDSAAGARPAIERIGGSPHAGSTLLLARVDGRELAYAADEDDHSIHVVDVDNEEEIDVLELGASPGQMVLTKDGRLLVAVRGASQLAIVEGTGTERSPLRIRSRLDVPTEPIGVALSPDEQTVVITSGWGRAVSAVDVGYVRGAPTLHLRASWKVAREPRSVVVADDGKRAFVSHAVGPSMDVVDITRPSEADHAVERILMDGKEEVSSGRESAGGDLDRHACQGFALAKSIAPEGRIFAPHVLAFTGDTSEPSSGYGGGPATREPEAFNVAVIDEDRAKAVGESLELRAEFSGIESCSLPRAAAASKAGTLFVTCVGAGADKVLELDAAAANPHDAVLRKWAVAPGPTGIALDDENGRAFVWSQFAHALTTIATSGSTEVTVASAVIPQRHPLDPELARGRALFHAVNEKRISNDGRACASCHPDGRDDTLVWSSPGGPRQTPVLAGRLAGTAPYGWTGEGKDVPGHLAKTFRRLGGRGMAGDDRNALVAFITAMPSPPTVALRGPAAPEAALVARGQEIFRSEAAGCATCHGNDGHAPDGDHHDVKSRATGDTHAAFDTPSLRFVGGSAPYFHDGRYATLHDLLVKSDGKMGHTKQLSADELSALEAFLVTR